MENTIGTAAGVLWHYLSQHGSSSVAKLKKEVQLTPSMLDRAIGWLAREGKIVESKSGKSIEITLKH
ncbi:MAG: winged helix-turn-helix domain-containing protein [bacterium]